MEELFHDPGTEPNPLWEAIRGYVSSMQELGDADVESPMALSDVMPLQGDAFDALDVIPGMPPVGRIAKGGIGILGAVLPFARKIIKAGKHGEPFFHGVKSGKEGVEAIMREGFKSGPEQSGKSFGAFLGEPAGVSITTDPRQAQLFAKQGWGSPVGGEEKMIHEGVMRVGLESPESSLAKFSDPEFRRAYKRSYQKAGDFDQAITPDMVDKHKAYRWSQGDWQAHTSEYEKRLADYLYTVQKEPGGTHKIMDMINQGSITYGDAEGFLTTKMKKEFNERLRRNLVDEGIEGIRYSPHRYDEFEVRSFMDEKLHPFGEIDMDSDIMRRYMWGDRQAQEAATKSAEWPQYGELISSGKRGVLARQKALTDPNDITDFSRLINEIGLNPYTDEIIGKGQAADIDKQIAKATEAFEQSLDAETKAAMKMGDIEDNDKAVEWLLKQKKIDDLYK